MKKIILSLVVMFILFAANSYAQEQISSKDAKDNIGKIIQVKGQVSTIFVSKKGTTFINFDELLATRCTFVKFLLFKNN